MAEKIIEDVAPELLVRVTKRFRALQASDKNIAAIVRRCAQPGATQADVAAYANRLGELLRAALVEEVEPGALPGGRLHLNIAEKLIAPQLRACHAMVNRQATAVQKAIDAADGVGLQTVEAAFPEERLHDLYWTACDPAKKTDPLRMIANETPTAVRRYHDDFIRANAEARYQAGMAPKIERVASFGACKWCRDRAGVFNYEAHRATGDEVFRRHANCGCSVTFINGRERQGVWTKKRWDASEDTRRQRIEAGAYRLTEQTKKATKEIRAQESMEAARLRYAVKHEGEQSSEAIFASARLDALRMERQRVENEVRLRERKRASDALREHGRDQSEKRAARIAYSQEKAAAMKQKRENRVENPAESGIIEIGRSVGAKAKNYRVRLPDGTYTELAEGTRIEKITVIAGKGRNRKIDEIDKLMVLYPESNEAEWQKKKGIGYVMFEDEPNKADIHWYEESVQGIIHDMKVKSDSSGNWFIYED